MTIRAALLAASVALLAGCAADATSSPDAVPGDEQDLKGALSQDLICAATAAADESNNGDGLVGVPKSKLKGDALADYKAWQKGMVSDYPSSAYELPVKLKNKTYTFWLVVEMNDGSGSIGVYKTTDGSTVATQSGGESSFLEWSKPADKCSR